MAANKLRMSILCDLRKSHERFFSYREFLGFTI